MQPILLPSSTLVRPSSQMGRRTARRRGVVGAQGDDADSSTGSGLRGCGSEFFGSVVINSNLGKFYVDANSSSMLDSSTWVLSALINV